MTDGPAPDATSGEVAPAGRSREAGRGGRSSTRRRPAVPPGPGRRARGRPVWPGVGAVLTGAFDLVTQARIPVRNASLYVGLLGLLRWVRP